MTFTDAAVEVLRLVGKPLHYKEITDSAIERNLLSHVGKSPEVTMGARLAALMKKEDGDNPLVRVKPGVFALREWDAATVKAGLDARKGGKKPRAGAAPDAASDEVEADDDDAVADVEVEDNEVLIAPEPPPAATQVTPEAKPAPRAPGPSGRGSPPRHVADVEQGPDDQMRAEAALGAGDMFDEEEDDDEPILGGTDDAGAARTSAGAGTETGPDGRRRRRRRRRGRGSEPGTTEAGGGQGGMPTYTATPVEGAAPLAREPREPREPRTDNREPREARTDSREPREARTDNREPRGDRGDSREPRGDRGDHREPRGDRDFGRDGGRDQGRDNRESHGRGPQVLELVGNGELGVDELAGRDMADVISVLLAGFDRNGGPVSLRHLVEALQRKSRGQVDAQLLSSQIAAAVRADNARRAASGQRPRFRFAGGRVGSTDWVLGPDLAQAERDALAAIDRYREVARRAFARRVTDLPGHAFVELVVLALEKYGVGALRAVRRPGGAGNETHFAGRLRGPGEDIPVAIAIRRDGRELGRERVTELRGALHHYGDAKAGFLFTSGQVLSGAREEAQAAGAAPVAVHDGASFARLCEDQDVAVIKSRLSIAIPDLDLLEALRAS